jgi:hypothetical protein
VSFQQRLYLAAQIVVGSACLIQKRNALPNRNLDGFGENSYIAACIVFHGILNSLANGMGASLACFEPPRARHFAQDTAHVVRLVSPA